MVRLLAGMAVVATSVFLAFKNKEKSNKISLETSILEENFLHLEKLLNHQDNKKILIIGQPGAGKSSLLLQITENCCSPKPKIGQQTDATNWSEYRKNAFFHKHHNMLYIDAPGYDTNTHPYQSYVEYFPFVSFDIIIFVLKGKIKEADEKIMQKIKATIKMNSNIKLLIARNFSEDLSISEKNDVREDIMKQFQINWENLYILFVSNRTVKGISKIRNFIHA